MTNGTVDITPSIDVGGPRRSPMVGEQGSQWKLRPPTREELKRYLIEKWGQTPTAAEGIVRNGILESGLRPDAVHTDPDGGQSFGIWQHRLDRRTALEDYAKKQGKPVEDWTVQADFTIHELQTQYPGLYKEINSSTDNDAVTSAIRRLYERPASMMWAHDAHGNLVIPSDGIGGNAFRFSEDALKTRGDEDLLMMSPGDYLALTPPLVEDSRKRANLLDSLQRKGEPIEEAPSLTAKDGQVVDSDGRHRALLAQESNVPHIPVNVSGLGESKELKGTQGNVLPTSAWRKFTDLIVPRAEAAPAPQAVDDIDKLLLKGVGSPGQAAPEQAADDDPLLKGVGKPGEEPQKPPEALPPPMAEAAMVGEPAETTTQMPGAEAIAPIGEAALAGAARGAADPALGALQFGGEAGAAMGTPYGQQAAQNALRMIQAVHGLTDPAMAQAPIAGEMGYLAGMVPYAVLAAKFFGPRAAGQVMQKGFVPVVKNMLVGGVKGAPIGGVSGLLAPEDVGGSDYWQRKQGRALPDVAFGTGMGFALPALSEAMAPLWQRFAESRERSRMLEQLPAVQDRVIEPLRRVLMERTRIGAPDLVPFQQFIESPAGQKAMKDELDRARNDVLGHGMPFNEAQYGVWKGVGKGPKIIDIDPAIAGNKDDKVPALRFLDAIRQEYDRRIDAISGDPSKASDLAILRNVRRQFTDLMIKQFPGYEAFLNMTDAYNIVSTTLRNQGVGALRTLFQSGSSMLRAVGNLDYGSRAHAVANMMQGIATKLRQPSKLTTNQLKALNEARQQLPGMPPARAEPQANALRRLGQSLGTGAAAMGPQVVPGL